MAEEKAIKAIEKARGLIINSVPKNSLVAIYIKGSFARREHRWVQASSESVLKGSDVDIVPIVAENKFEKAIFGVNNLEIHPCIVVPLSLWELENNKLYTKNNRPRAKPDEFVKRLGKYKLIYGKSLETANFNVRTDREALKDKIKTFKKSYISLYEKGKYPFSALAKEVFWLVEYEQSVRGIKPEHSFKGISESAKDPNHIIHDAYKLRESHTEDKKEKEKFIKKLKKHLDCLENLVQRPC